MKNLFSKIREICVYAIGLSCALSLAAQPTITSQTAIQLGESAPVQFAVDGFNPGASGINVTWNFSGLTDDTLSHVWLAENPSGTPFADSFPNANLAFRGPAMGGSVDNFRYYSFDSPTQTLLFHGSALVIYNTGSQDTTFQVLHDPKAVQTFPFSFGATNTDNFEGLHTVKVGGFVVVQTRTGVITLEGESYGTLITPAGTFANVLRVKTTENITDNYLGFNTVQTITRYTWYSPVEKYLLLEMDSIVTQPAGGPANFSESVIYRNGTPVVHAEEASFAEKIGLQIYPNPAQAVVHIRFESTPETATLTLTNIIGQTLIEKQCVKGAGFQDQILDLGALSPGTYFVHVRLGNQVATQKLILH